MGQPKKENRKEIRHPVHAEAVLERSTGETIAGLTVNVSGSGVLVDLKAEPALEVGEAVNCGVRLYQQKPPQSWGTGRVVRVENSLVAIDFSTPSPACTEPSVEK